MLVEINIVTATSLHFGPIGFLVTMGVPFGTLCMWKSRYALIRIATALRGYPMLASSQEPAVRLSEPFGCPTPLEDAKRLSGPSQGVPAPLPEDRA